MIPLATPPQLQVLMLADVFPPGLCGIGDYSASLARALVHRGVRVTVLTKTIDQVAVREQVDGLTVQRVTRRWSLRDLGAIRRLASELGSPTIVHVQYPSRHGYDRHPMVNLLPAFLRCTRPRAPVVVTLHEYHEHRLRWKLRVLPMLLAQPALVMVREIDQAAVARWLRPVPPSALIPVASSIPAEKLNDSERHALRRELGLTPEAPVLVFFGDVRPDKGVLDLLEASAAIRRRGLDARLLMLSSVGSTAQTLSGYERRALERIAVGQREGWLTLVRSPAAHRVAHLMNASDVAVFPFTLGASENRTSLLSAIVNRLPVLTTRGPSTPAGFESRYGVTTVPARDTAALATAAEILLRQPEQRETLRQKAACAAQRFTWDAIADQTIALYRKCLL